MNQIAAMSKSLLKGEVLSIMNCFKWFGVTNCPREIGRSIERKFNVEVMRTRKDFVSRYGQPGYYYEYRLLRTPFNADGINLMETYVSQEESVVFKPVVKRGPKKVNVTSNKSAKQVPIEFNTETMSWDSPIE